MKITALTADSSSIDARRAMPRAERRARKRLHRAANRFARTEATVESALARLIAAERALVVAVDRPDLDEIYVEQLCVPRSVVPEVLAMAQSDLKTASRRQRDAAARMSRCVSALAVATGPTGAGVLRLTP